MIRLTPAVFWNHLKGGADAFSRYMKTSRSNISENPALSIVARLPVMQVNNTAIFYRLFKAKENGKVRGASNVSWRNIYSQIRHDVTECEVFAKFARQLAREWNLWRKMDLQECNATRKNADNRHSRFSRQASNNYNSGADKQRRLGTSMNHSPVAAQGTDSVLCSYSISVIYKGETISKRRRKKQVQ